MVNDLTTTRGKGGAMDARSRKGRIDEVISQMNDIQELMKRAMKEGLHYGIQPGTDKMVLFLPGAEKLRMLFRINVKEYDIEKEWEGEHLHVTTRVYFTPHGSDEIIGVGIGMCSTMEAKYRYRGNDGTDTGIQVPKKYWDLRNEWKKAPKQRQAEIARQAQEIIGGKNFFTKKNDQGMWTIWEKGGKAENPNIADTYNTVIKISKKRAYVDGIRMVTAASDIFDVDLKEEQETIHDPEVVPVDEIPVPE